MINGINMETSVVKNVLIMNKAPDNFPINAPIPNNIQIDITNACNLKCIMCPNKDIKIKKGAMHFGLFKRIIDEIAEYGIENAGLYTVGEPFMNSEIFEFIVYAKNKGVKYVYVTTNGQLLNKEKINKIFDSGLDSIKFSIDASSQETYEKIRIGAKWKKLIENIDLLNELRNKRNSNIKIFASFTLQKRNLMDLIIFDDIFNNRIDETLYSIVATQGGLVPDINILFPNANEKISNTIDTVFNIEPHPCNLLWNRFVVTWDGKLTICCSDFEEKLLYGNLNESTLSECWNNSKMREYRKIHKNLDFKKIPNCQQCDFVRRDGIKEHEIVMKVLDILKSKQGRIRRKCQQI